MDGHLHFLEVKNSEILKENTLHISTENVWLVAGRVGNLEKFGIEPKKVGMESFDGCAPCLTSVNRSKSIFFSAEKANSVCAACSCRSISLTSASKNVKLVCMK